MIKFDKIYSDLDVFANNDLIFTIYENPISFHAFSETYSFTHRYDYTETNANSSNLLLVVLILLSGVIL